MTPQYAIEEFLKVKSEILEAAKREESLFQSFRMLPQLQLAEEIHDEEKSRLLLLQSLDERLFIVSTQGIARLGKRILSWLKAERTFERADQLLTWLINSGDSVRLYASLEGKRE